MAASEVTKLVTLRTPVVVLAVTVAATVAMSWALTSVVVRALEDGRVAEVGGLEPGSAFLMVLHYGQIGVVVLAAYAVLEEQDEGSLRSALLAVPQRGTLLGAKVAVVAVAAAGAAVLSVVGSWSVRCTAVPCAQRLTSDALPLGDAGLLAGVVVSWVAVALLTVGLALLVRNALVAMGLVLATLLALSPYLRTITDAARFLPDQAAAALIRLEPAAAGELDASAALVVLAVWVLAAVACGAASLHRWRT